MKPEDQLIKERIRKLNEIRELDINPYPYTFKNTNNAHDLQTEFKKLQKEKRTKTRVSIAGRIMLLRRMGKVTFMQLQDQTGRIQLFFAYDNIKKNMYKFLKKLDLGDFIGVEGTIFKTRTGELTIDVKNYELLTKSLRPLPEKFHGLKDEELRFRHRYVDLIVNPNVKEIFVKRSKIISAMREFLNENNFLEVEIPTLQPIYGGANAKPFKTHINAWDMDLFLSISPELYLKRLIVGGFHKVFTICKNFRNEGVDQTHNPEFTMMECYWAYADYNDMMKLTEDMCEYICKKVLGTTKVKYKDKTLDFKVPWERLTMKQALKKYANIDVDKLDDKELFSFKEKYKFDIKGPINRGRVIQMLFEELCEEHLLGPVHITDHPKESTPLCKLKRGNNDLIERFESFILYTELTNAYSELNDPILQRKYLEEQSELGRGGDEEAHQMDEDFIRAIETGMPPCGGLGLGVDRLAIALTGTDGIRDVILFPTMKPEMVEKQEKSKKK